MATKRKPRIAEPSKWPTWLRLSTLATVASIYAVVGPLFAGWLGNFEKVDHARAAIAAIYEQLGALARNQAWQSAQQIKTEANVAGNRVTECDVKNDRGEKMTPLERQACARWRADAEDAQRRYQRAYAAAEAASKALAVNPERAATSAIAADPVASGIVPSK